MELDPRDVEICLRDEHAERPPDGGPDRGGRHGREMTTPVVMTSLFAFPTLEALQEGLANEHRTHVYTRGQNPTVEAVERKIAALERGEACKAFGSGMAAISAVLLGLLRAGDHVLFVNHTYGPTLQLAERLRDFGVEHDLLLDGSPVSVERALRPHTRLVWLESPGTMLFRVLDLPAIAQVARRRGVLTCLDNSWATPLLQKPLTLGIDVVVHTASKYLNGHSDLMAGAVVSTASRMEEIFYRAYLLQGGILPPHDAWMLLRGMRTLPARLRQQEADALAIASALREHPDVRAVHHPALAPDADLAARHLRGYTGTFSFELRQDDVASVRRAVNGLRHFRIGVSWGGVESLVIAPATGSNDDLLAARGIPRGLIRLSIGLEGADVLLGDLRRALVTRDRTTEERR